MATNIGLPSLTIAFRKAAQAAANRSKKGYVGVFVRDAKAQGVHQLTSQALIPSELGEDNRAYLERAFTGSDRGEPSKVVAVVIAPGTEDTTALAAGLKLIESMTLDYVAGPPDVTAAEKTLLETWVKGRREAYFTEKLVEPNPAHPLTTWVLSPTRKRTTSWPWARPPTLRRSLPAASPGFWQGYPWVCPAPTPPCRR